MSKRDWSEERKKRELAHRLDASACFDREVERKAALVKPSRAAMQRARARRCGQGNAARPVRAKVARRKVTLGSAQPEVGRE